MSKKQLIIKKGPNGIVSVSGEKLTSMVDCRGKTPEEALEAVRWAILLAGHVWTPYAEKIARKELGL